MSYSEVESISGYVGNFKVKVRKKERYVDLKKCTGCAKCMELCPIKVSDEYNVGLSQRKAIYIPFAQAVPNKAVIDAENCSYLKGRKEGKDVCRLCQKGIEKKGIAGCEIGAIDFEQVDEIVELEVGSIIIATGYDAFDPSVISQYGYGKYDNVVTALQFERMCSAAGPTAGKILMKDGREPESIAIIHCVGSRDKNYHEYCSQVCCMYALKYSHLIKEKTKAEVYQMYIDMRCVGKAFEEFYDRLSNEGVKFIRGKVATVTDRAMTDEEKGKLTVSVTDTTLGEMLRVPVDMVVLCAALEPRADADKVARLFTISRSKDGFFLERHAKLDPIATMTEGIFVVGCCLGPKDIPTTVAQAAAGATRALALISRGRVKIEPIIAFVDEEICAGCGLCAQMCAYGALSLSEQEGVMTVNKALCKGCGACTAICPSGAMSLNHFTYRQLLDQIEALTY
jgi:heterodisulfide reductase subunit A